MRGNAGEHLLHDVIVGSVVESWWYQWHRVNRLA
jgi:hypothetical protein